MAVFFYYDTSPLTSVRLKLLLDYQFSNHFIMNKVTINSNGTSRLTTINQGILLIKDLAYNFDIEMIQNAMLL